MAEFREEVICPVSPQALVLLCAGAVAAVVVLVATGLVRHFALARAVLDVPNERSLHAVPTPRGGGLAIGLTVTVAVLWLGLAGRLPPRVATGLLGAMALVLLVGWVDDVRSLSNRARMLAQAAAACWFLVWIGGFPVVDVGQRAVQLGWPGAALALVGIVWSINLYNFMDGIDGIAGGQGLVAASFGAALLVGAAPGLALLSATIAGACLGFLGWNWSPARIFMGDAGSGLLGFLFAAIAILSERSGGPPVLAWLLFGGVFIFDATVTLVRRFLRGERWYAAHRSHAYQRAVQSGWSHARVTIGAMVLAVMLGALGTLITLEPARWTLLGGAGLALLLGCYLLIEQRRPMWPRTPTSPPLTH